MKFTNNNIVDQVNKIWPKDYPMWELINPTMCLEWQKEGKGDFILKQKFIVSYTKHGHEFQHEVWLAIPFTLSSENNIYETLQ